MQKNQQPTQNVKKRAKMTFYDHLNIRSAFLLKYARLGNVVSAQPLFYDGISLVCLNFKGLFKFLTQILIFLWK